MQTATSFQTRCLAFRVVSATALSALVACSDPPTTPTSPARTAGARVSQLIATTTTPIPLYQQAPAGVNRLCFAPFICADDFVVPSGERWTVSHVILDGARQSASVPLTVRFYADAGGLPGALLQSFSVEPITSTPDGGFLTNYLLLLPTPVTLTSGTYWIATTDFIWRSGQPSVGRTATFTTGGAWAQIPVEDFAFSLFTLRTPASSIEALQGTIAGLGLHHGTANSLDAKLRAALGALADNDEATACEALQDFLNHVRAQRGKKIPATDADAMSAEVTAIRNQLGC